MILGHHFHVFIFEAFLGFIISHLISERSCAMGLLGFALVYVVLSAMGLILYQYFLRFLERSTGLALRSAFNQHVIKEFRVSFGLIMLPILVYSLLNWTFQDESSSAERGSLWFLEFFTNIVFVSVLTISCTVILLLKLLPNREITEPEYLAVINKRLGQIGMPKLRVKWIEADLKNAFVVGLKLLRFSNQTMFIGRNLRTMLTMEEFDAVIAHELSHIANRHIHKRVIELLKNFITAIVGMGLLMFISLGFFHLYFGEDVGLHEHLVATICALVCMGWMFFNYSLFFDVIRSHEYEADAYAVINMGAKLSALSSALEKLGKTDEVPEYLKAKAKTHRKKNPYTFWLTRHFSTHPELKDRIQSLEHKIEYGLPFNYYVSRPQKIRSSLSQLLNWRISAPLSSAFALFMVWTIVQIRAGSELVRFIQVSEPESIMKNKDVAKHINAKPYLVGKSLMSYIVKKQNPILIDFYLSKGADPGRTLIYLSESQNFDLFKAYYLGYAKNLTLDEYYLVLLRSADVNFTDGYRFLVNSSKFDSLSSGYKAELVRNQRPESGSGDRRPASAEQQ
jgi:Zn-dependent protease with chaperone function